MKTDYYSSIYGNSNATKWNTPGVLILNGTKLIVLNKAEKPRYPDSCAWLVLSGDYGLVYLPNMSDSWAEQIT